MMSQDEMKKNVALKAIEMIEPGMSVGLGSGTTATQFILALGEKVKEGLDLGFVVSTSDSIRDLALGFEIQVKGVDEVESIDISFDGADKINLETGQCIKGWGGAAYLEKKVALKAQKFIIMVDESKIVDNFDGVRFPLEVREELRIVVEQELKDLGYRFEFRDKMSDSGNLICDVNFIDGNISLFAIEMMAVEGVIGTGLFENIVSTALIARANGEVDGISFLE